MRFFSTLLVVSVLVLAPVLLAHAQDEGPELPRLEKSVRKEWKARLRELEPEDLKAMTDKHTATNEELVKRGQEVLGLKSNLADSQEETAQLKAKLDAALAAPPPPPTVAPATAAPAVAEGLATEAYTARHAEVTKGVLFKVQIGYFRNKDLSKYFENTKNFSGDVETDGSKKYTLGAFTNYWEADNFKKYLREMGVRDAWTVAYRDGKRVPLRDVLEGAAATHAATH